MKITLEEIARMANVSKATVSRVINNVPTGVSDQTRRRVKDVLSSMNYVERENGESGHALKTCSLGLIIPDITNPFFAELAREISNAAMQRGYTVLLGNSGFSPKSEQRIITAFVAKRVDGVLFVPTRSEYLEDYRTFARYHVPCVLLDRDIAGMERCAAVLSDNANISYRCCELLITNGSERIAYITGTTQTSTAQERLRGYREALSAHGLPYDPELIVQGNYTLESGYNAVLELERKGAGYQAVLCGNDLMALGAIKALHELCYAIPDDREVIGFDNIAYSQYTDPPLTTVQQPTIEMGRKAVELLVENIEGRGGLQEHCVRLQPKLLRRKTTR